MARVLTVNDVLDGHVALDIECLDRIYLNAYVPILQTSSQVVAFLSGYLGFPFPSPVLFRQLTDLQLWKLLKERRVNSGLAQEAVEQAGLGSI